MTFDSIAFGIFFLIVFGIYWWLSIDSLRRIFLTFASFFFYGFWDYRYVFLMIFVIVVAHVTALAIARSTKESHRQHWLVLGIAMHLSVLFFFKYVDFFLGTFNGLASSLEITIRLPLPNVLLPVGISFFTFHAISYTIDVFRNKVSAERDIFQVALYISFFPQLIAGPIVRSTFFLPQLQEARIQKQEFLIKGLHQFTMGFLFKTVLADNLATLADPVFNEPAKWDGIALWVGALAYYAQIYFDFAGYSLMAIGCSLWFGYQLPDNFSWPYTSISVTEFWQRWHISLSSWLRDYLYFPLGGNRHGKILQYRNLALTMIIGGLWHGASWNFIIWGGLHGIALIVHKIWVTWRSIQQEEHNPWIWQWHSWLLTQTWIFIAWIFFRSKEFADAWQMLLGLCGLRANGVETLSIWFIPLIICPLIIDALFGRFMSEMKVRPISLDIYAAIIGIFFAFFLWLKPLNTVPFIYFQF